MIFLVLVCHSYLAHILQQRGGEVLFMLKAEFMLMDSVTNVNYMHACCIPLVCSVCWMLLQNSVNVSSVCILLIVNKSEYLFQL